MDQHEPRVPHAVEIALSRRSLLGSIFGFLMLVQPLGARLFAALEAQPLTAQVGRLLEALAYLGESLSETDKERIVAAAGMPDGARALHEIQEVLDPRCLLSIRINPESRISVDRAAAQARLVEQVGVRIS